MNSLAFLIVFAIIIMAQIALLCSMLFCADTALAGNVETFSLRSSLTTKPLHKNLKIGSELIDLSPYMSLIVHGNSMQQYKIYDGQRIYVETYKTDNEKKGITNRPVVVFKINHSCRLFSQYKLRKFVVYIDYNDKTDWKGIYHAHKEQIQVDESRFLSDMETTISKISNKTGRLVLSETYDEFLGCVRYSLHHYTNLVGKVKYAI